MKNLLLILVAWLVLFPVEAFSQAMFYGQNKNMAAPSGPSVPHPANFLIGTTSPYTGTVNTAGAGAVWVASVNYGSASFTIVDGQDRITLTNLACQSIASVYSCLSYEKPTSTSTTATFTFTGYAYGHAHVMPIVGVTGVYDGNITGTGAGTTTCSPGSITPGSGTHMVITGFATNDSTYPETYTLSSPYTIAGQYPFGSGSNFGGGGGYYATGAATNPTWTAAAGSSACTIASTS